MNEDTDLSPDTRQKKNRGLKPILGAALKMLLVLAAGTLIGAVVYFTAVGWVPYLEQRLFSPIEENKLLIQEISETQQAYQTQLTELIKLGAETQQPADLEIVSALRKAENELNQRISAVETINAYSLTQVPAQLGTLTARQAANESFISALATAQMDYRGNEFESQWMIVIVLLSRANQFLLHDNYGLAEDQLIAAQQLLQEMDQGLDSWQRTQVDELMLSVTGAINDLPDQPELANQKLALAWQITIQVLLTLPDAGQQGTVTPTPGITATPTPKP